MNTQSTPTYLLWSPSRHRSGAGRHLGRCLLLRRVRGHPLNQAGVRGGQRGSSDPVQGGATVPAVFVSKALSSVHIADLERVLTVSESREASDREECSEHEVSTTVIARLFFSIHDRKDPSIVEARRGMVA